MSLGQLQECHICFGFKAEMKVLPCKHEICTVCLSTLLNTAQKREIVPDTCKIMAHCPDCRADIAFIPTAKQLTDHFPSRYYGWVKCELCQTKKRVDDMWWCTKCIQVFCSRCEVVEHRKKLHLQPAPWIENKAILECSAWLEAASDTEKKAQLMEDAMLIEALSSHFAKVAVVLVNRLRADVSKYSYCEALVSQLKEKYKFSAASVPQLRNPKPPAENVEKAEKVAEIALQLAGVQLEKSDSSKSGYSDKILKRIAEKNGEITQKIVEVVLAQLEVKPVKSLDSSSCLEIKMRPRVGSFDLSIKKVGLCRVLDDYKAVGPYDLSIKEGDTIKLIGRINAEWFKGRTFGGQEGIFPADHVEIISPLP